MSPLRFRADVALKLRLPLTDRRLAPAQALFNPARLGQLVEGIDYRGVEVAGVARAIPGTDWFLMTKLDRQEFLADATHRVTWIALSGLLILLVASAGLVLMHQRQQIATAQAIEHAQSERLRALHLLAAIADSSSDAIFAKDLAGRYILFNRESARVTGKTDAEVLGSIDTALFPPEQAEMIRANDRQVLADNRTTTYEETLDTVVGKRTFLAIKGPLLDSDGKVIGLFGISRDITERHRMETTLAATADFVAGVGGEDYFQDAVRHAAESLGLDYAHIALLTPAGNRVETLAAWLDGHRIDNWAYDLAGTPCAQVLDLRRQCIVSGVQALYPEDADLAKIGAQGYVGEPLADSAGRAIGLMVGITRAPLENGEMARNTLRILAARAEAEWEQRAAVQSLRESELFLRVAVGGANLGLFDWNVIDNSVHYSPIWKGQLGYREDEIPDEFDAWRERVHPDDLTGALATIEAYMAHPVGLFELEHRLRHKDGDYRWILARGMAILSADDKVLRLVGGHLDITSRKLLEGDLRRQAEELRARNEELEQFNRLMIGRELDMIQLKQQINALSQALGQEPPFDLAYLDTAVGENRP